MKDIKGYEGLYAITKDGRVWSYSTDKRKRKIGWFLNPCIFKNGYYCVTLSKGIRKKYLLHRLIALAFIPNPENKICINHKNGIKTDNRIENLEWCTYSENSYHAFKSGLRISLKGEETPAHKLKASQVREIRKLLSEGVPQRVLSRKYRISRPVIKGILDREYWRHI